MVGKKVAVSCVIGMLQLGAVFLTCWKMDTVEFSWIGCAVSGVTAVANACSLVFLAYATVALVWRGRGGP